MLFRRIAVLCRPWSWRLRSSWEGCRGAFLLCIACLFIRFQLDVIYLLFPLFLSVACARVSCPGRYEIAKAVSFFYCHFRLSFLLSSLLSSPSFSRLIPLKLEGKKRQVTKRSKTKQKNKQTKNWRPAILESGAVVRLRLETCWIQLPVVLLAWLCCSHH